MDKILKEWAYLKIPFITDLSVFKVVNKNNRMQSI